MVNVIVGRNTNKIIITGIIIMVMLMAIIRMSIHAEVIQIGAIAIRIKNIARLTAIIILDLIIKNLSY